MSCERFRKALTDAAAGEPAPPALETHLAACDACRAELERLRSLVALADQELAALAVAEPSPSLPARIREAVADQGEAPVLRWRFAWSAAAVAMLALAALGAWRSTVSRAPVSPAVTETAAVASPSPPAATDPSPGAAARAADETRASEPARSVPASPVRARPPAPEVLVPAGEREALLLFVALVHREGLQPSALSAAGAPSAGLAEPAPIEIQPLEIVPLDPATAEEATGS
jgi:hypothetical protein